MVTRILGSIAAGPQASVTRGLPTAHTAHHLHSIYATPKTQKGPVASATGRGIPQGRRINEQATPAFEFQGFAASLDYMDEAPICLRQ
jgi:hypothetical protein